jgi:hypothetical protein
MPVIKWFLALALALALALSCVPAAAQPRAIEAPEGTYEHPGSLMGAPAELTGLARGEVQDLTGTGRDIMIQYRTSDRSTFLTVYFYRSPHRSAGLWFEQARRSLEVNPVLGGASQARPVGTFGTPGAASPDAFVVGYGLREQFRSTALAVATVGNWIVKLRMTSSTLDEEAISERIVDAAQALQWPERSSAAAATPIQPCSEHLPTTGDARDTEVDDPVQREAHRQLVAAAHSGAQPPLCFDRQEGLLGIYREAEGSGYLLALGDSGRFARIREIGGGDGNGVYAVEFYDIDAAYPAGFFRGLPTPQQVLQASDSAFRAGEGAVRYLEEVRPDKNGTVPVT